ncbi:uncharacterized protein CLUP02_05709 [Colletotrichum lupini]|uniref:Uncharacterized protein n=1 Tax=Colletotrichum lupini TaxID=145971 RepID=A0A9Q8WEV8_9PEZI|nr:uncharacterized protein CLUP02_05709 [Colletotrichum lupini]UQC80227.1 hypothetical protein CLUP02_05709 [Colletotrichum lupini]
MESTGSKLQTSSKARTNITVIEDIIYIQNFGARTTKVQSTPAITLETESRLSVSVNKQDVSCRLTPRVPQSKAYTEVSHYGRVLLAGTVQSARAVSPAPKSPSGNMEIPSLQDPDEGRRNLSLLELLFARGYRISLEQPSIRGEAFSKSPET